MFLDGVDGAVEVGLSPEMKVLGRPRTAPISLAFEGGEFISSATRSNGSADASCDEAVASAAFPSASVIVDGAVEASISVAYPEGQIRESASVVESSVDAGCDETLEAAATSSEPMGVE